MPAIEREEDDRVSPSRIVHDVDLVVEDGVVEQVYNFLDYQFERGPHRYRARAYLDEIDTVWLFGPTTDEEPDLIRGEEAPDGAVVHYLLRRFERIKRVRPSRENEILTAAAP